MHTNRCPRRRRQLVKQADVFSFEEAFDRGDLSNVSDHRVAEMLRLVLSRSFLEALQVCELGFKEAKSPLEKGIFLEFGVGLTEDIYDLNLRTAWLKKWNLISGWTNEPWLVYLRQFQFALTPFFSGDLIVAEAGFERALLMARSISYSRGEMRCLYHLALINESRGFHLESRTQFEEVQAIAKDRGAVRMLNRLKARTNENWGELVESLVSKNKLSAARKMILHWERARRHEGVSRERDSLAFYWAILMAGYKRFRAFEVVQSQIVDPVVRERLLRFCLKHFDLTNEQREELRWLQEQIRICAPVDIDPRAEIIGFSDLADPEVKRFIRLLLTSSDRGLDKESIVREVWQYNSYDPVLHDQRVYKLVSKARRMIKIDNWLENNYGSYRLKLGLS